MITAKMAEAQPLATPAEIEEAVNPTEVDA